MADRLADHIFNLKFAAKGLYRQAAKTEREEKTELEKIRKALAAGKQDRATTFSENAIRKRNEQAQMLQSASRIEAVVSRLQTVQKTNNVVAIMGQVVKALDAALSKADPEAVSNAMDTFERQFENLDIRTSCVEEAMQNSVSKNIPSEQVKELIQQVADANNLDVSMSFENRAPKQKAPEQKVASQTEQLDQRLALLKK